MRKTLLVLICCLVLSGCSVLNNEKVEKDSIQKYETYLTSLIEQDRFLEGSYYFSISAVFNKLDDGQVRYDVFIEDAQVAMYSIEILVIENTAKRTDTTIYPCVGIFENEDYTMVPFQKNESQGFVEGFQLTGVSSNEKPVLNILVTWKDYAKLNTYREFIKLIPKETVNEETTVPDIIEHGE